MEDYECLYILGIFLLVLILINCYQNYYLIDNFTVGAIFDRCHQCNK